MPTIKLKNGSGTPTSGALEVGEPAIDLTNKKLYTSTNGTDIVEIAADTNANTNLSATATGTSLTINSSTGNNASVPAATISAWGAMTDEDKTKLDGIDAGAEVNVGTDLGVIATTNAVSITSSTGTDTGIPLATSSGAGIIDNATFDVIDSATSANLIDTLVQRDGSGDFQTRNVGLTRTNQATISGAMAFRVNNSTDNDIRFCSDAAAIRTFIGAGTGNGSGTVTSVSGANGISGTVTTSGNLTLDSDLRSHAWIIGRDTNDYYIVNTTTHSWYIDASEDMRLSNTGTLDVKANVVAFSTTLSDERLKDNVETISSPLDTVAALRGVTFEWNKGPRNGQKDIGVIAQEVQAVLPEVIAEAKDSLIDGNDYLTVNYGQMAGLFIECFKEVITRLEALENK